MKLVLSCIDLLKAAGILGNIDLEFADFVQGHSANTAKLRGFLGRMSAR